MIHALQIVTSSGGRRLLDEVSMSAIGGEVVGIVGPSGAGKSTLIQVLGGARRPQRGHLWLGGRDIGAWSATERAQRCATLPQHSGGDASPLLVREVMMLGRAPHIAVRASQADRDICGAALSWVEAAALCERIYATLSAGEQRRVLMARLLAQLWGQPQRGDAYALLDEPAGGDPVWGPQAMHIARQLAQDGAAVVVAMGDVALAAQCCDRLLLLHAGQLVVEGAPAQVLTPYHLRRTFGATAAAALAARLG